MAGNNNEFVTIAGFNLWRMPAAVIAARLCTLAQAGQGAWIMTLNLEMLARMRTDAAYALLTRNVDYATADGMPLVWASRWCKKPVEGRCTGIDLSRLLLESPVERVALIGGQNPHALSARFTAPMRRYTIMSGAFTYNEENAAALLECLRLDNTQLVLLALGVPLQDYFAAYVHAHAPHMVVIGVGSALDALAGLRAPVPCWMQNAGLEWLFRLASEPRRLWRRYLLRYPYGLALLLQDLRRRRHE